MVVWLGPTQVRWRYASIAAAANFWLIATVAIGVLPWPTLVALLSTALSIPAARGLVRFTDSSAQLAPAIQMTIGAASLHGILLTTALVATRILA